MIKLKLFITLVLFFLIINIEAKENKNNSSKSKVSKNRYIDLEGLDVQGIIDRPGTLYILKKSKVEFQDTLKKYDYLKEIINSTYKEPF